MEVEDVGESPIQSTKWAAGESANPEGRPKGVRNVKPRSKMRNTLSRLYSLQNDAIDIIKESLKPPARDKDGNKIEVDRTQLDTAKFVVKAIESYNNNCLKEELAILGIKDKDPEAGKNLEESQEDKDPKSNFSMDMEALPTTLKH